MEDHNVIPVVEGVVEGSDVVTATPVEVPVVAPEVVEVPVEGEVLAEDAPRVATPASSAQSPVATE
jgi:hypothetical protein